MNNLLKKIKLKDGNNKKKIENLVVFIIILIVTLICINTIWKENKPSNLEDNIKEESNKILANEEEGNKNSTEENLENILTTIKGVGKVKVYINYSESSSTIAMYDETTTTSQTQEGDSSGGTRNMTETEVKKDVIFSEESGKKQPVTQKTTMPIIQGAIVTAEGAKDPNVKTNIINAVGAVTGLTIDKVQVFEMDKR